MKSANVNTFDYVTQACIILTKVKEKLVRMAQTKRSSDSIQNVENRNEVASKEELLNLLAEGIRTRLVLLEGRGENSFLSLSADLIKSVENWNPTTSPTLLDEARMAVAQSIFAVNTPEEKDDQKTLALTEYQAAQAKLAVTEDLQGNLMGPLPIEELEATAIILQQVALRLDSNQRLGILAEI